jgi:hypothetical protein
LNSSKSCEVFINFAFLTFLPLPLPAFASAAASAAALSCDACDAASRVGLFAQLERRGSWLGLSLSVELFVELRLELSLSSLEDSSTVGVLGS